LIEDEPEIFLSEESKIQENDPNIDKLELIEEEKDSEPES
jgi:hypothetical protein